MKNNKIKFVRSEDFSSWFVGFSDAEGSFNIVPKKQNGKINRFSFMFVIRLHVDDFNVLGFIQNNLNIGRVVRDGDECKFLVTDKDGIDKLISIFDKYTLNSSKYLDYLDFKEAFRLYFAREGVLREVQTH